MANQQVQPTIGISRVMKARMMANDPINNPRITIEANDGAAGARRPLLGVGKRAMLFFSPYMSTRLSQTNPSPTTIYVQEIAWNILHIILSWIHATCRADGTQVPPLGIGGLSRAELTDLLFGIELMRIDWRLVQIDQQLRNILETKTPQQFLLFWQSLSGHAKPFAMVYAHLDWYVGRASFAQLVDMLRHQLPTYSAARTVADRLRHILQNTDYRLQDVVTLSAAMPHSRVKEEAFKACAEGYWQRRETNHPAILAIGNEGLRNQFLGYFRRRNREATGRL